MSTFNEVIAAINNDRQLNDGHNNARPLKKFGIGRFNRNGREVVAAVLNDQIHSVNPVRVQYGKPWLSVMAMWVVDQRLTKENFVENFNEKIAAAMPFDEVEMKEVVWFDFS